MSKEKPYQPSEEEIQKAEEIMTEEQKEKSSRREELMKASNWYEGLFPATYKEPSYFNKLDDLRFKYYYLTKDDNEKTKLKQEIERIESEEKKAKEDFWERYKIASEKIKSLIGGDINSLPRGFDRDGWGRKHVDVGGYRISYKWSNWVGDSPLVIESVEPLDNKEKK